MRSGDRDRERAVREIYDAHYGALAGWAGRLVGDRELGHDLATEAFVRLLRDHAAVHDPHAWLYAVTANLVRDHWRRLGRERSAYGRVVATVGPRGASRRAGGGVGTGRGGRAGRSGGERWSGGEDWSGGAGGGAAGSDGAPGSDPDPATRLTVREVVLALPDRLRLPVILHYYADLPVAVVAARLGKSEGTVKRDLFEARRRMATQLEEAP